MNETHFTASFARQFERSTFVDLARLTGWLRRQGKIDAFEFLVGLVLGQMSALRLTLNAQATCGTVPVTRQAVDQRYNERAVEYFHAAFGHCLQHTLAQRPAPALHAALAAHFAAIHLVDSSGWDCPASLAPLYPGCGGDASAANVKLLLRYEYLRSQFEPLALVPGKRSDQGLAGELLRLAELGHLIITDKGFFKLEVLRQIQQAGAYFLMPWPRSVGLWLPQPDGSLQALDLAATLRASTATVFERPAVQLGAQPEAPVVRLVAFRLNEASANRARAGVREAQRKQGRTPTAAALELAGWLILITNVPPEKLPTAAVSYLYRVRWQIELVFKQCKSVLRLDQTEARQNVHRVQCEIWARLIGALVVFSWHGHLQVASWARRRAELSFGQVSALLQAHGLSLAAALIAGGSTLRTRLWHIWNQLLWTTRKGRQRTRKTTWQSLQENWLNPTPP